MPGFLCADILRRFEKIPAVQNVKNRQKIGEREHPNRPDMRDDPKKRNAFQVPEEKRRNRRSALGRRDVANEKDKKDRVECRVSVFIDADPRADKNHGAPVVPSKLVSAEAIKRKMQL